MLFFLLECRSKTDTHVNMVLTWRSVVQPQVTCVETTSVVSVCPLLREISLCGSDALMKNSYTSLWKANMIGQIAEIFKVWSVKAFILRSTPSQKLCAVRGRNCVSVLMPVRAVCCCHSLPLGRCCWCHSAWWHGSVVGISADGLWQEWAQPWN